MGWIYLGEIRLTYASIITLVLSVLSMALLTFVVQKTKLGKAMRAVSEDTGASQLMGININHIITFTFAVGAALAGVGALLYSVHFPLIMPTIGMMLGLRAFVAAVLGGIGSIPGTMLGGYLIAFLEVGVIALGGSRWTDGAVFLILILVLMLRPTGIMGRSMMEKV
ncbi:MAG: branched-chain amino acid ABC transporter permease, partial [Oscillospiraceae bacterium]|nr:branched-chain amino acid ABC transporter permease [Oscillospiraceae bacterium]